MLFYYKADDRRDIGLREVYGSGYSAKKVVEV
jgi:hypothetical protein